MPDFWLANGQDAQRVPGKRPGAQDGAADGVAMWTVRFVRFSAKILAMLRPPPRPLLALHALEIHRHRNVRGPSVRGTPVRVDYETGAFPCSNFLREIAQHVYVYQSCTRLTLP